MNIKEEKLPDFFDDETLFISEGGAVKEASFGIEVLANEIKSGQKKITLKNLKIFLPKWYRHNSSLFTKISSFEVITCSCVGDGEYLKSN